MLLQTYQRDLTNGCLLKVILRNLCFKMLSIEYLSLEIWWIPPAPCWFLLRWQIIRKSCHLKYGHWKYWKIYFLPFRRCNCSLYISSAILVLPALFVFYPCLQFVRDVGLSDLSTTRFFKGRKSALKACLDIKCSLEVCVEEESLMWSPFPVHALHAKTSKEDQAASIHFEFQYSSEPTHLHFRVDLSMFYFK